MFFRLRIIFSITFLFSHRSSSQSSQTKQKPTTNTTFSKDIVRRISSNQSVPSEQETWSGMSDSESREHGVLKRTIRKASDQGYRSLSVNEFLAKPIADIRMEFRRMPNPPAKDTHAAK